MTQNVSGNLPTLRSNPPSLILTWRGIERIVDSLGNLIERHHLDHIDVVVGISRGGIIPAALLARRLKVDTVKTLIIQSYDDLTNKPLNVVKLRSPMEEILPLQMLKVLVVDDIADSGETMSFIRGLLPAATRAAIITKPQGFTTVHYTGQMQHGPEWVVFPWEKQF